jgi:hypothetical protein
MTCFAQLDARACVELASAVIAAIAALYVVLEYNARRREARYDRAATIEAQLTADPTLRFAITLLDWGEGQAPVPDGFTAFIAKDCFIHDRELLFAAMRPTLSNQVKESRDATMYRLVFVELFNYLERVLRLWKRGYVRSDDLPQTRWLAQELLHWTYARSTNHAPETWFSPAMADWYKDVHDGKSLDGLAVDFTTASAPRSARRQADRFRPDRRSPSAP